MLNELLEDRPDVSGNGTDSRILDSAIVLFAERGFADVTVREIAEHAGANPAAINYYFGGKERLIRHVIRSVFSPLNEQRLAALAAATGGAGPLTTDAIVRALVEPTVHACMRSAGPERYYAPILLHTFALRQPFVDEAMAEQNDRVPKAFVDALSRAMPGRSRGRIFWHFDFMIGSIMHILLDGSRGYRLRRLSEGEADTSSAEDIVEELVGFIRLGLSAGEGSEPGSASPAGA
jgi:AcrR family transcriptional regulator